MKALDYYAMTDEERLDKITALESHCDKLEAKIEELKNNVKYHTEHVSALYKLIQPKDVKITALEDERANITKTHSINMKFADNKIEELEMIIKGKDAVMVESKTCEGCKHNNHLVNETDPCNSCMRRMLYVGYCNDSYEPKATK